MIGGVPLFQETPIYSIHVPYSGMFCGVNSNEPSSKLPTCLKRKYKSVQDSVCDVLTCIHSNWHVLFSKIWQQTSWRVLSSPSNRNARHTNQNTQHLPSKVHSTKMLYLQILARRIVWKVHSRTPIHGCTSMPLNVPSAVFRRIFPRGWSMWSS